MEFAIAGASAMGACCFTNPLEVLKTRMQLQGELQAKGHHAVHYKNVLHAGYVVAKNDGVLALQKGLVPALWVQLFLNGMRLGTYQFANNNGIIRDKNGNLIFYRSALVAGIGGTLGGILSSPCFLIKTHLQAQASSSIAVGHQHNHEGLSNALLKIYNQNGIKGLFRGVASSIPRSFVGSVSQLIGFEYAKEVLLRYEYFRDKRIMTAFLGSMVGGVTISIAMTPFDLIMTRLYNQRNLPWIFTPLEGAHMKHLEIHPDMSYLDEQEYSYLNLFHFLLATDAGGKGQLYSSYMDCVRKIYRTEGMSAFYKGVGPMYLRLGPHTVLCLVFWDGLNNLYAKFEDMKPKISRQ